MQCLPVEGPEVIQVFLPMNDPEELAKVLSNMGPKTLRALQLAMDREFEQRLREISDPPTFRGAINRLRNILGHYPKAFGGDIQRFSYPSYVRDTIIDGVIKELEACLKSATGPAYDDAFGLLKSFEAIASKIVAMVHEGPWSVFKSDPDNAGKYGRSPRKVDFNGEFSEAVARLRRFVDNYSPTIDAARPTD